MATIIEELGSQVKVLENTANDLLKLAEKLQTHVESLRAIDKDEAAVATTKKAFVNAPRLDVFEKPNRKSAKVGEFSEGNTLSVIDVVPEAGEATGWVKITEGTYEGKYVSKKLLDYNL